MRNPRPPPCPRASRLSLRRSRPSSRKKQPSSGTGSSVGAARARAQAPAACRPLRAVFYAATDYLRLATKLAATASPCAEYYVSIPPLVADKTKPRPNAASRIRALGPNFHAMAEFHFATWTRWVASTGSSWYTAGRHRARADGGRRLRRHEWRHLGAQRAHLGCPARHRQRARERPRAPARPLRGQRRSRPAEPSSSSASGSGQPTSPCYQTNLQNWFADSAFWADMTTYVSDWSQEVYGDVRSYAVPGVPLEVRRDYLNDYLQHELVLARAGPPTIEPARSFLQATFSPLANAAWERETGYGWTMVPPEQMAAYVSGQVHALRYFSATSGQAQDRWGFAWAPRNGSGLPFRNSQSRAGSSSTG